MSATASPPRPARRVGVLGYGAIGGRVADLLANGRVPGCDLAAVLTRSSPAPRRVGTVEELVARSDIVVEAAGHRPLARWGPRITAAGVDLLVVSVGALVDDSLLAGLRGGTSGGRLLVSSGALGGLDLLRAASLLGPFESVTLESRKRPDVLVQPWMALQLVERLRASSGPVTAFEGTARQAARQFPESANVAATLGLATLGLDAVRVTMIGDPAAAGPRHVVHAEGAAGSYEVSIANAPSPANPRTSAITPFAVVRALQDLAGSFVVGA